MACVVGVVLSLWLVLSVLCCLCGLCCRCCVVFVACVVGASRIVSHSQGRDGGYRDHRCWLCEFDHSIVVVVVVRWSTLTIQCSVVCRSGSVPFGSLVHRYSLACISATCRSKHVRACIVLLCMYILCCVVTVVQIPSHHRHACHGYLCLITVFFAPRVTPRVLPPPGADGALCAFPEAVEVEARRRHSGGAGAVEVEARRRHSGGAEVVGVLPAGVEVIVAETPTAGR